MSNNSVLDLRKFDGGGTLGVALAIIGFFVTTLAGFPGPRPMMLGSPKIVVYMSGIIVYTYTKFTWYLHELLSCLKLYKFIITHDIKYVLNQWLLTNEQMFLIL